MKLNPTAATATEKALEQIEEKKYATELIERGIQNRKKLAIDFNGNLDYRIEIINSKSEYRYRDIVWNFFIKTDSGTEKLACCLKFPKGFGDRF